MDSVDTRVLWGERAVGIEGYGAKEAARGQDSSHHPPRRSVANLHIKAAVDLEEEGENPDDDGGDSEPDSYACVSVLKEAEFESVED